MSLVDVVIPTLNRQDAIVACLGALARQDCHDFGVIVVDDGSEPPVASAIPEELFDCLRLRVLRQPARSGPGAARNRGVRESDAEYIVFIDDDVRADPALITRHLQAMQDAGGRLVTFGPLAQPADWKASPWTYWEATRLEQQYEELEQRNGIAAWRALATGNACVRREEFLAVGGFDPRYERAEDAELALRLAEAGCQFRFLPGAVGWHDAQRSLDAWLRIPTQYCHAHQMIDRDHPEVRWMETVLLERRSRHALLRFARTLGRPFPEATARGATTVARLLFALGARNAATSAISAAFDLRYTAALDRSARSADPSLPPHAPRGAAPDTAGPATRVAVSVTWANTRRVGLNGPRRDFIELARESRAIVHYPRKERRRQGLLGRFFMFGAGHAWQVAGQTRPGDVVYADQELLGIALLGALAARRRRPARVVILAHLPGWRWRRAALWAATRLGIPGCLVVHSTHQREILAPLLPRDWQTVCHPYQVDTDFWRSTCPPDAATPDAATPVICAVGSERRDYETLVQAVEGLPVRLVIAAGSEWARSAARAGELPPNVEYFDSLMPHAEIRRLYQQASAVVVPLVNAPNQAGITSLLESMSMARPAIVSATDGQREAVVGPLVRADRSIDPAATADRGPVAILPEAAGHLDRPSGYYVPVGDADALRAAIRLLLDDPDRARELGDAGRRAAERYFTVEQFAQRFAATLAAEPPVRPVRVLESAS